MDQPVKLFAKPADIQFLSPQGNSYFSINYFTSQVAPLLRRSSMVLIFDFA